MESNFYRVPLDENQRLKISRMRGRKSVCFVASLDRLFILIAGRKIFSIQSLSKAPKIQSNLKYGKQASYSTKSAKLVLELDKKCKPLARSLAAYSGHVLLQLEDDHLELYKYNEQDDILEIIEKLSVISLRNDRCVALGHHFLLFGKEGARAYSKAMVGHVLSQESIASVTIAHGAIYVATPHHEIVEHSHPFYQPKVLVSKTETIDALASLENAICSLQVKKTTDLFQKAIHTAKNSLDLNDFLKSTSVIDTLMNIGSKKVDPSYENAAKKLVIHSSISTNTLIETFDLDEFGFLDRVESDGDTNLYLYGPASIKPLVHFNITTKAFALLPIPEHFLIIDVLAIPHSHLVYILIGKKCDKQMFFGVDSSGFTEFSEVQLIEGQIRVSSKKRAEDDRDNLADLGDVMKALRRLDYRMERIENLLLTFQNR